MELGRKSARGDRFVPRVETLEDRTVPAGDVRVTLLDGTLYVSGDDQGNQVMISATGHHSAIVRALDATTRINGQQSVAVKGIDRDYYIDLFGGDDVLVLNATRNDGSVRVGLGSGNDLLTINDAQNRKETTILAGDGNDTILLGNSTFRRYVFVDSGAGDDQVTAFGIGVGDFGLKSSGGNDFFNSIGSTLLRADLGGFAQGLRPADTSSPVPTLTTTASSLTGTSPIPFTITYSKDVTGVDTSDLVITNGTTPTVTRVNARTYTFQVAPTAQGVVTARVLGGGVTDPSGIASVGSNTVSVTFDSTAPAKPTFNLAPASDSGAVGDLRTDAATVTLTGTTEAGATVKLFNASAPGTPATGTPLMTTTAAADGTFSFANLTLALGPNSFAVQALDAAGNASTFAQTFTRNTPPTVAAPIGPQSGTAGGSALTFDLATVFTDVEKVVRLATTYPTGQSGNIDINLFDTKAPQTVANFLSYVNNATPAANYNDSIFHRLAPGFVLQGGGFKFNDAGTTTATAFPAITKSPPVVNEPGISNTLGTIAMAKQGNDPNSATNEFFFNLGDNSANLDSQNGGFTVFGQVMNGGQQTVDAIASLSTYNGAGIPGAPPFPVSSTADTSNFPANINAGDLASVTTATELTNAQKMSFSVVGNTDGTVASASVTGGTLTITPLTVGTTTITVQATDLDGSSTTTTVTISVS